MSVDIPSDLVHFVHSVIASGRCHSESEVVGEALRLLEVVERKREQLRADALEGTNSGESISRDEVARHVKVLRHAVPQVQPTARVPELIPTDEVSAPCDLPRSSQPMRTPARAGGSRLPDPPSTSAME